MIKARVGESTYFFNSDLELYFSRFKQYIIGHNQTFSAFGKQTLLYADWTASGRLYKSIEEKLTKELGPFVGNTHTESNITGTYMTKAYEEAKEIIKSHVHANEKDILLFAGSGMTAAVNKLQRILGLKQPKKEIESERPIVFVTHMEHHSNYLSWVETNADVEMIPPDSSGDVNYSYLEELLKKYKDRKQKIGAFTACSNVTGRKTDYHHLASIMHNHNGLCFIDFSASAPYIKIDMHPSDKTEQLDAIYFSPHKFLGGPGTSGVVIMNKNLLTSKVPDLPGGGTVDFTNQWGDILYKKDIEEREDGGTPGFLQAIKTALAIKLKENMGIQEIEAREKELVTIALAELEKIEGIEVLDSCNKNRLGVISFIAKNVHYDLMVRLLNDRFGIQVRGGCSCAGPYGHHLLHLTKEQSKKISQEVLEGDFSHKPGWVRLSLHPTMSNEEVYTIIHGIKKIILFHKEWETDYAFCNYRNEYVGKRKLSCDTKALFDL
ncbi:aminotransferase class V-fold PLP-dependent enzyme [Niallia sp. NCCP-28]|uniref:aminotransferase class V-fold PLP-dependent enzyme n=1 Tax=Niallia sp. NCCP-28 TaxID=2934712 RepID=UPI002084237D|nr:selenocysteine lyase [Niallia sp. NCCP-28]